ncbi:DNA-directed RNA polymerase sigma-70 factor [Bacteroidales bacterium]|nr:DNA-directed RNA polymerase sigma-70 factor [Bacteroidales bacterium]
MDKNKHILDLLKKIAQHSCTKSFNELYACYYNRLFRQALYFLNNNPDCAQEVVSDVFVALWQGRKVLDKIKKPDSYFFIALKHAVSRYIAENYKQNTTLFTDNLPDIKASNDLSDFTIRDKELQEEYQRALESLPPRCAEVFRLVREQRKKYAEVAEILGISIKTVDNQMNKAVKILYQQLKENLFSIFF